ncbi:MAG: coiled-coil domain-containing protein [Gammaproteobacteria bacterium]
MLMGVLQRFFQDVVVPELKQIRAENAEVKTTLQLTNKRLDDINLHLAEQSRRIDETNKRIDETNKRIDSIHADLIRRVDETNDRLSRLYEVIVRRDEHDGLAQRLTRLEQKVEDLVAQRAA